MTRVYKNETIYLQNLVSTKLSTYFLHITQVMSYLIILTNYNQRYLISKKELKSKWESHLQSLMKASRRN